jgi:serpin B
MTVVLPRPAVSIGDFQNALTAETRQEWTSGLREMEGDIVLPRFRVDYGTDLLPGLVALGGGALADVDFHGMGAGPLQISRVIHKAFVEANEEGTEAAAASAVTAAMAVPVRFTMVVDRPFFFAIRDDLTGALLFTGFVLDPAPS